MLIFFSIFALVSFAGMANMVYKYVPEVMAFGGDEFQSKFVSTTPIFSRLYKIGVIQFLKLWRRNILPFVYSGGEKIVHKIKTGVVKLEDSLEKLDDHLRRKSIPENTSSKKSEYWDSMSKFKNKLDMGSDK